MYVVTRKNGVRAAAIGAVVVMGLAACSGSDADSSTTSAEAETTASAATTPETTPDSAPAETTPAETTPPDTAPAETPPPDTAPGETTPETTTTVAPTDPLVGIGEVTVVAEGLGFLEGPQWIPESGTLLFTELFTTRGEPFAAQPGIIYELGVNDELTVARATGPTANGLEVAEDGTLYATEPGERRVAVIGADGVETAVADQFEGKRLNGPNDVVAASDGSLYFTDPEPLGELIDADLGFRGAFRVGPDGAVTLVYPGLPDNAGFPNGIGLSPDETTLYVTDSTGSMIWSIDLGPDGTPGEPVEFAAMEGLPDGICIDPAGNVYSSSIFVGIEVFAPDGTKWGSIPLPSPDFGELGTPSNCEFGGEDGLDLYITTDGILYRVRMAPPT